MWHFKLLLGQVGVVYRGILTRNNIPQPVAMKTIKCMWIIHSTSLIPINFILGLVNILSAWHLMNF